MKREREETGNLEGANSGFYLHIQGIKAVMEKLGLSLEEAIKLAKKESETDPHQLPFIEKAAKYLKKKRKK